MKYFDKSFINGELSDEEYEHRISSYNNDLKLFLEKNDITFAIFANYISLHDAIMLDINKQRDIITSSYIYGSNQIGYYEIEIHFHNASCDKNIQNFSLLEIVYTEFSCYKNMYTFSCISVDAVELDIDFDYFDFSVKHSSFSVYMGLLKKSIGRVSENIN